jgi:hypothetical protein
MVPVTAKASMPGTISLFCIQRATFVVQQGLLELTPITEVTQMGEKIVVTAKVTDTKGVGMPGIQVIMTVSGGAVLDTPTLGTDATGTAKFTIDTSQMGPVRAAYIAVSGSAASPGLTIASCQLAVPVKNAGPAVIIGTPFGVKVNGADVALQGSVTSPLGFSSVTVKMDNDATVTLVNETDLTTVALSTSFGKLGGGDHTLVVNATDSQGVSTEKTITFSVAKASLLPWLVAGICLILLVVVVVLLLIRGRRPKTEVVVAPPPEQT